MKKMAVPKRVSLTFDNGPDPEATPDVLDTLAHQGVRASFFFVGQNLQSASGRALAQRAHKEGHRIGNHTFSHGIPFGSLKRPADAIEEVEMAQALLGPMAAPDRLFRPNGAGGGRLNHQLMSETAYQHLQSGAYTCVLWNSVPEDWCDPEGWLSRGLAQIERLTWPVVVIHDLPTGAMKHLETFILKVRDLGGEFTQEFPTDCVPLLRGERQWDIGHLMTDR
jgi:peptidoglycan/xylan/chitin deacetylase (PgdA/CDA1 family)